MTQFCLIKQKSILVSLLTILSYHQHLLNNAAKVSTRCNLLKRLASNHWCANFTNTAVQYGAKAIIAKKVNNEWFRLVGGCITSTPTVLLLILSGIEPADIRWNKNILSLCIHAVENTYTFHQVAISPLANARLKSRMPPSTCIHHLSHDIDDISPEDWVQHPWGGRWRNFNHQINNLIAYPNSKLPTYDLKWRQWAMLNHFLSGHGQYASFMHRIRLQENVNCISSAIQNPQQVRNCCIIGIRGDLRTVDSRLS